MTEPYVTREELLAENAQLRAENAALRQANAALQAQVATVTERLTALEQRPPPPASKPTARSRPARGPPASGVHTTAPASGRSPR